MTRLWLALVCALVAVSASAQSVVLRNPDGSQAGTSSSPVRTDPTGSTSQPVTNGTASNFKAQINQLAAVSTSATLQSAATANGNGTLLSVDGMATAVLTVNCASCSGGTTVTFEATEDGSNFVARDARRLGADTVASALTTSGVTVWEVPVAGFVSLRARILSYSAGTVTVTGHSVPMTAGLTLQRVDGSTFTQPVSAASLPLPTGAATAAKQPALGTAGSASSDVITVQGVASMTALKVDGSAVTQPVSGTVTVTQGTATSLKAQAEAYQGGSAVAAGNPLQVTLANTGANSTAVKVDGSAVTQPVSGTVTATQATGTNLHMVCDSGCSSSAGFADNSAFTFGTTAVNPIAGVLDDTATNAATENSAAVARITAQKALHINLRNNAGTEIGTSTTPVQVSLANTAANATAVKVDGSAVTQPISGTVTANAGTNLNTSALALESGGNLATVASAVRAEDSASADADKGVALLAVRKATPANTSGTDGDYEALQISAGRLYTSSTIDAALPTGSNVIGALSANQSVNVAQVNGVTTSTGVGAAGTGTQRVVDVASGTTGSAVPTQAAYIGGNGTGNLTGITACDSNKFLDMTTATTTELVALTSSQKVRVCSFDVETNGTAVVTFKYGTGTNCGTGTTQLGPAWDFTAQTGIARGSGLGELFATAASNALCLTSSAAVNVHVWVTYTKY